MPAKFESISTASAGGGSSLPTPKPAGLLVGELMIGLFGLKGFGAGVVLFPPSGWTSLTGTVAHPLDSPFWELSFKVADAADVAASDFTFSSNASSRLLSWIMRISGAALVNPVDVQAIVDSVLTSVPCPDILATAASALIVRYSAARADAGATGPPTSAIAGHTKRGDFTEASLNFNTSVFTEDALQAAGQTGVETIVYPGATGGPFRAFGGTIAVQSAITGGGPTAFMGDPSALRPPGERMQRAEGYKVPVPKGLRLKNPVRRIEDAWRELRRK